MSAIIKQQHKYTLEEYIELEKNSEEKFEFRDGNVWSMAGASPEHEIIVVNVASELRNKLRGKPCKVFSSGLRVKVSTYAPYRYPDLTAVCGQPVYEELKGLQLLTNPNLIVEILSPSTKAFDLGEKFTYYKSIESFTEYLLIDQEHAHVVLYTKRDEKVWLQQEFNSLDETLFLTSMNCELALSEIYYNIEFPERPRMPMDDRREEETY